MISLTSTSEAAPPGDILEARPGAATTRMLGTAELVLAEHRAILTDTLASRSSYPNPLPVLLLGDKVTKGNLVRRAAAAARAR